MNQVMEVYGSFSSTMQMWYEVSVPYVKMKAEYDLTVFTVMLICLAVLTAISLTVTTWVARRRNTFSDEFDRADSEGNRAYAVQMRRKRNSADGQFQVAAAISAILVAITVIILGIFCNDYSRLKVTAEHPEKPAIESIMKSIRG